MDQDSKGKYSIASRGARYQLGMAVALITIVPSLALCYLVYAAVNGQLSLLRSMLVGLPVAFSTVCGYVLIIKYPINVVRLRDYLEGMVSGKLPDHVRFIQGMDDIPAIERSLKVLIEQVDGQTGRLTSINEQLQLEVEERRRAENLKDEFVSTVSHELRTPLTITREGICLMIDQIPGPVNEKQMKVLTSAKGNVDRLARIINDLLDMSKIEAGRMTMARERISLADLIRHVTASMLPLAEQKGLSLTADIPDDPLEVLADEGRIVQVFTNLVGNAIKFTSEGSVKVLANRTDGEIACIVEDTGVGVSKEDQSRLFNKFVQLKREDGAGRKGTGLGLVIAKNIIELHGGNIHVDSEPDRGSKFTFVLPEFSAEQILLAKIEEAVLDARDRDKGFSIFLCEVRYDPGSGLADAKEEALGKAFQSLLQARSVLRQTDSLELRGNHQVVLLAQVGKDQAELVQGRWHQTIKENLRDVAAAIPIQLLSARASYPDDGSTAQELMRTVEENLTTRSVYETV
jgi:signal transduction histidine kinase